MHMHYNYTCLTWPADTETLDCTHVANTAACVADCQHRNVVTQNMLTLPGIIVWPHSLQLLAQAIHTLVSHCVLH